MSVRQPVVAGSFYPDTREKLSTLLDRLMVPTGTRETVPGVLVPHAGYMYSGPVAGSVYSRIFVPDEILILSPNHTGYGAPVSIWPDGEWITPLGSVPISAELTQRLRQCHPMIEADTDAQRSEHAAEVHLPFLQKINPNIRISVLTLAIYGSGDSPHSRKVLDTLVALGSAIAEVLRNYGRQVLIVASSDMNHYESDDLTRVKDAMAMEPMKNLDAEGLFQVLERERVSMCGYLPAAAAMTVCKKLGAVKGSLVQYQTSVDAGGDRNRVVGYAGMIFQ